MKYQISCVLVYYYNYNYKEIVLRGGKAVKFCLVVSWELLGSIIQSPGLDTSAKEAEPRKSQSWRRLNVM